MELEVFVHGALCIAHSGQCLTSEAIGGRSANRGACAQACRLPYELVVDGVIRDLGDRAYLLSPEDLESSAAIPGLVELGIASVKIEGRLKGPEYVAATTALYRAAIDAAMGEGAAPPDALREAALQTYSRGSGPGFLEGVNHQRLVEARGCDHRGLLVGSANGAVRARGKLHIDAHVTRPIARGDGILVEGGFAGEGEIGGRIWGVLVDGRDVERAEPGDRALLWLGPDKSIEGDARGRVFKTNDPACERAINARIEKDPHKVPIEVSVRGAIGSALQFEARTAHGASASVTGDAVLERADGAGSIADAVREKLERLGDTPFVLARADIDLPSRAKLPISSINRARRALTAELLRASHRAHATTDVTHTDLLAEATPPDRSPPPAGLFVLCRTLDQAMAAADAGADGVYLDFLELTGTGAAFRALRARGGVQIGVSPPRIRKPGEEKIDRYLMDLAPDAILVRGLGALLEGSSGGPMRIGDFSLNVTNKLSAAHVLGRGVDVFTPSFDLDGAQLTSLVSSAFGPFAEIVVHHPMPLFHMEHCVIAALLSEGRDHKTCGRPCDRHKLSLRDRAGMDHPVEADVGCRNTVFHAAAQSAASLVGSAQKSGVRRFRIELVRESAPDTERIVHAYRRLLLAETTAQNVWRDLRTQSGYGIVRGSLRVIAE
jgi:putative protease